MIYLYVIKSENNGDLYVGICKVVTARVKEHNSGKNRYTKGLKPWKLLLLEEYPDWKEARVKEKYYKGGSGKEYLRKLLVP
jgi:putative endonuclease